MLCLQTTFSQLMDISMLSPKLKTLVAEYWLVIGLFLAEWGLYSITVIIISPKQARRLLRPFFSFHCRRVLMSLTQHSENLLHPVSQRAECNVLDQETSLRQPETSGRVQVGFNQQKTKTKHTTFKSLSILLSQKIPFYFSAIYISFHQGPFCPV